MAIGEPDDFRSKGWQQFMRFPGQDHVGGPGSAMLHRWTQPSGSTNMSPPVPPLTVPGLTFPNITFPGITLPNQLPPVIIGGAGTGTAAANTVIVSDTVNPSQAVTTINFIGSGLVGVTFASGAATVEYEDTGGSGSTLVYGKITNATRTAGTRAFWTYTVQPYVSGSASGGTVTAYNLLENDNSTTAAYGYSIVSSGNYDRITSTNYYIKSVPVGAWVRMEQTSAIPSYSNTYWFEAPNRIDGAC